MCFDLPECTGKAGNSIMPHEQVIFPLKVDLLIISRSAKIAIFCELTYPNEENLEYWNKEKANRYNHLLRIGNHGWNPYLFTLEIGSRGFVLARSFYKFTYPLGFSSSDAKELKNSLSRESLRCSYVIWINRFNKALDKSRLTCYKIKKNLLFPKRSPHTLAPRPWLPDLVKAKPKSSNVNMPNQMNIATSPLKSSSIPTTYKDTFTFKVITSLPIELLSPIA